MNKRPGLLLGLFLTCSICLITTKRTMAQDVVYSQYYNLPLTLNPAFAGSSESPKIIAIFRDQWPDLPQAYVNYALGWEQHFSQINSSFGLVLHADHQADGLLTTQGATAYYAYQIKLGRTTALKAGFQAGWSQRRLRWQDLRFFDQINPVTGFNDASGNINSTFELPVDNEKTSITDLGAGLLIFGKKLYAGIAFKHLNQADLAFYNSDEDRLPILTSAQLGAAFETHDGRGQSWKFSPQAIFVRQQTFGQLLVGAQLGTGVIYLGSWYRHAFANGDAVVFATGLNSGILNIGYSYDVSISKLAGQGGGSHEVSLQILLTKETQKQRERNLNNSLKCPLFY